MLASRPGRPGPTGSAEGQQIPVEVGPRLGAGLEGWTSSPTSGNAWQLARIQAPVPEVDADIVGVGTKKMKKRWALGWLNWIRPLMVTVPQPKLFLSESTGSPPSP